MTNILVRVLGVSTMTMTLAMGLQPLGCASDATSAPLTLQNNWAFTTPDGYAGTGLTITKENTYAFSTVSQTGPNALNAEIERGTVAIAGNSITFTPEEWTCQEPTDPAFTATFQIQGDTLTLGLSSGVIVFKLNTTPAGGGSSTGLVLTNGCFLKNGTFVRSPLTPVGSCGVAGGSCSAADATCCNTYACTNGGTCAAVCTQNAECKSGCCLGAPGTVRVCAAATNCP